jgi:hypothetical protein
VQFRDGSTDIGSPVTLAGGTASTSTSSLTAGAHTLHAVFIPADDTAYYPSSDSTSYTLTSVTAVDTITSLSVTPSSAPAGTAVTLQADVVRASDNVALTTGDGSVEFYDNGTTSLGSEAIGSSGAEISISSFTQRIDLCRGSVHRDCTRSAGNRIASDLHNVFLGESL